MKKNLVALATLAVAGGAYAQSGNARAITGSGVEIFGVADVAVNRITVDGTPGVITQLDGGGRNESTRLGFRGMEDIGGGWGAGFWLEAGIAMDNGAGANTTTNNTVVGDKFTFTTASASASSAGSTATVAGSLNGRQGLTFNRASVVSLLHRNIGEIRLGRDYAPSFWNQTGFDPFGTVGVGAFTNVSLGAASLNSQVSSNPVPSVRTSNSVGWLSNDIAGFRAQVQYAFSEMPTGCTTPLVNNTTNNATGLNSNYCGGSNGDGRTLGYRLQYMSGPLHLAAAYTQVTYGDVAAGTSTRGILVADGGQTGNTAGTNTNATTTNLLLATNSASRGNLATTNFGGSYTAGAVKVMAQMGQQALDAAAGVNAKKFNYNLVGATYAMGSTTLKASVSAGSRSETAGEDGTKIAQTAVGFVTDLSKRTAVYGNYATLKMTAGGSSSGAGRVTMGLTGEPISAGNSATTSGFDLGIRHRF